MKKDAYYFSHDANARNDEKILKLRFKYGYEGYGIYWAIVETLREAGDYGYNRNAIAELSLSLGIDVGKLGSILDFCLHPDVKLFFEKGERFYSRSLLRRMKAKEEKSHKMRQNAKLRWDAKAKQLQCNRNAIKGKESKVKESKVKENKVKENNNTWRNNYDIYKSEELEQYSNLINNITFIKEQEKYYPNLDIRLTLEKAHKQFWGTEAGWQHKKKKMAKEIDWKRTFENAITMNGNKVWKQKEKKKSKDTGYVPY